MHRHRQELDETETYGLPICFRLYFAAPTLSDTDHAAVFLHNFHDSFLLEDHPKHTNIQTHKTCASNLGSFRAIHTILFPILGSNVWYRRR